MTKKLDVIVFGATGFTGRLVAQYLNSSYGAGGAVSWAMAGRSLAKLTEARHQIAAPESVPLLVADADDAVALAQLVPQARVIISTTGPYQLYGTALITACAHAGTDYVDLCGEPAWMARMIPLLDAPARASGARIVFSCGFDSIPFDLGVVFIQHEAMRRFGSPLSAVHGRVRVMKGGFSGGTAASLLATIEAMARDPGVGRIMADPFALTPGFRGPAQPDDDGATYDAAARSWTAPFMMAPINTKNVHRTNALGGHGWGEEFVYSERMLTGDGSAGERRARRMVRAARIQNALLGFSPTRTALKRLVLPKPGRGPSEHERETGHYEVLFIGSTACGQTLRATVKGDRDPGYGSTSKMIAEAGLCLAEDAARTIATAGVWTPGAAMGLALIGRLQARAGLTFSIEK